MFIIQKVTQKQIDGLETALSKSDAEVFKNEAGVFKISSKFGEAEATYDAATQALTVTVKHKPVFIPEAVIEHGLIEAIAGIPAQ